MVNDPSLQPPERFLDEDKSLACVHCGLCLGSCPTYLETGNENDSPRGRIYLMRALQEGRLPLWGEAVRHIDLCLGCRACENACPSGVAYGALLEETREHLEKHHTRSVGEEVLRRIMIAGVFPFPERLELLLKPARWLKHRRWHRFLPGRLRSMMDLIPEEAIGSELSGLFPSTAPTRRGCVGFVTGCVMSVMFPGTNRSSVALLNRAGYDVVVPPAQECCGALDAHGGNLERARRFARRMIDSFSPWRLDAIIINAAGCGSTMKEYAHLLKDDRIWAARGEDFSARVKDLTEWLESSDLDLVPAGAELTGPVTYHDACHLAHPQRITTSPRRLVRRVAGDRFVELPEADVCCGSAGSYNLTEPEMASRLQRRKISHIDRIGARMVVTSNPGCILQIQSGYYQSSANPPEVLHISDFLWAYGRGASERESGKNV